MACHLQLRFTAASRESTIKAVFPEMPSRGMRNFVIFSGLAGRRERVCIKATLFYLANEAAHSQMACTAYNFHERFGFLPYLVST